MDEHLLTWLQVGLLDQRLPGGEGDQRQRGGLGHGQSGRLGRDVVLVDGDEFGERADAAFPRLA